MGTIFNCRNCGDPVEVKEVTCGACSLEGSWYGPDKVAHFLFPLAVAGWGRVIWPEAATAVWIAAIVVSGLWELSNIMFVFKGVRGASVLDFLAFLASGLLSGVLLWVTR